MNKLDLMRDAARTLPVPERSPAITHLRIWHCKYRMLAGLERFAGLQELVIAGWPDPDFSTLAGMKRLRVLRVLHLPKVSELSHLAELERLESLSLATLPSWEPSGKKQIVKALEPIAELPKLELLELFGVVTKTMSLAGLEKCPALVSAARWASA